MLGALLAKAAWSAAIVLGLSWLAERVSARVAGLVSGAPQNAVIVYFFIGWDMGIPFVVESVPHGIAAFTATIGFVLAYHAASSRMTRWSVIGGPLAGLAVFLAIALVLVRIPFTLAGAAALTLATIGAAVWLLRRVAYVPVTEPVRYTVRLLALRASGAAALIVGVIALAQALGPRWAGLLAGFPTILLPTLLIIHLAYGRANAHAIIRNFPLGVVSIVIYLISLPATFAWLGVPVGTVASLALSVGYLAAIHAVLKRSVGQSR